jgi:hypothetical protein
MKQLILVIETSGHCKALARTDDATAINQASENNAVALFVMQRRLVNMALSSY